MKKMLTIIMLFLIVYQNAPVVQCPDTEMFKEDAYTCLLIDGEIYSIRGVMMVPSLPVKIWMKKARATINTQPAYVPDSVEIDYDRLAE